jgi:hypothetical protein
MDDFERETVEALKHDHLTGNDAQEPDQLRFASAALRLRSSVRSFLHGWDVFRGER